MEAPNVSEGLRPTRLLPGCGDPSLTVGALTGVSPTNWAGPSFPSRAPLGRHRGRAR